MICSATASIGERLVAQPPQRHEVQRADERVRPHRRNRRVGAAGRPVCGDARFEAVRRVVGEQQRLPHAIFAGAAGRHVQVQVPLGGGAFEVAADEAPQRIARSGGRCDQTRHRVGHPRRQPQRERLHQRVAIADAAVQDRLGHAGFDGDRVERHARAAFADQPLGRGEQRFAIGDDAVVAAASGGPAALARQGAHVCAESRCSSWI